MSRSPSADKEVLFNNAICQSVLASSEQAPAVKCVLFTQDASIGNDEVGSDIGSDISQVDWQVWQTMDSTLNRVIQLLTSSHKPTMRQIALESKECPKVLKDWDHLFFQRQHLVSLLVGFGFNGPLRQYFSLYRAVSQREGERGKKG